MIPRLDLDAHRSQSRALHLADIAWHEVSHHPLTPEAIRALQYMQDIEAYTIIYLRELLATRAVDDLEVSVFLAGWFYEETFHGRALARFLEAAGYPTIERVRSRQSFRKWLEARGIALVARAWPSFVAVHMVWGAINELTTLTGYQRLAKLAAHPVLDELLARIMRDESRHFAFYFSQAERRLARPGAACVARFLVDHFWAPVGSGVQPDAEVRFLASYLLSGPDGRAAARKIDATIRTLPGFEDVVLMEEFTERAVRVPAPAAFAIGAHRSRT